MPTASHRQKLSTTVSVETHNYLQSLVEGGQAESIAEAVDRAVETARLAEQRARLERDTAAYFENLSEQAAAEERELGEALGQAVHEIDFER